MTRAQLAGALAFILAAPSAWASPIPFDFIRIGDRDGFGYTSTAGLFRTTGAAADTNGNGLLEQGEFLPDLNRNGSVATGSGDDFDHRSAAEKANTAAPGGSGFTNGATTAGSKWSDISLSTSFTGPDFPDPGGPGVPNQPVFIYDFFVASDAIIASQQMFFNLVFGDYDVSPANVTLTFASAAGRTVALSLQPGAADGLIQAATALLDFNEVFTATAGGWNGLVTVSFIAPNEPYTAFDYTEISVTQISGTVPLPPTVPLVGLALVMLALQRRRTA